MHESQQTKEATEIQAVAKRTNIKRPYRFYVLVTHRQVDMEGKTQPAQFLTFEDKASLRAGLDNPAYESAELRIVRGYEMNVKAKRQISVN